MKIRLLSYLGLVLVLMACSPLSAQPSGPVSFVNTVAVGDSLTAGVQSGVIKDSTQVNSWVSLVIQRARTYFLQPLIPPPGFGNEIRLVNGELVVGPFTTSGRTFPLIVPQNLAIPGHDTFQALTVRPNLPLDTLEDVILGVPILIAPLGIPPLSQIELAVGLEPTFTFFWLGSNDVLKTATSGRPPTPLQEFQVAYTTALGALATMTQSRIVVGNLPDVTVIPFLVPATEIAEEVGAPIEVIGPILGIQAGDCVRLAFIPLVEQILTGQAPGPLPPQAILTRALHESLHLQILQMNGFINALAAQLNIPVVDINGKLADIDENGYPVGNFILTTDFLGGLFSLDAVHPTNTGQAIIANAFIEKMNEAFGLTIPPVDVLAIALKDPLVFKPTPTGKPRLLQAARLLPAEALTWWSPGSGDPDQGEPGLNPGSDPQPDQGRELATVEELLQDFRQVSIKPGSIVRRNFDAVPSRSSRDQRNPR